jgi:hypothetical protein
MVIENHLPGRREDGLAALPLPEARIPRAVIVLKSPVVLFDLGYSLHRFS